MSYQDHLSGDIPEFAKYTFMFHVYYAIRRIIFNLKAPLLTAQSWNALDNSFDAKSYEQICEEFHVDTNTDWRQRLDANGSLGLIFTISPAHGTHHSRAFHIMLTKCRSYSISQMVLQYQAWSVSMIQSAHIAGQSSVLNLRSNPRCRQRIWCAEAISRHH